MRSDCAVLERVDADNDTNDGTQTFCDTAANVSGQVWQLTATGIQARTALLLLTVRPCISKIWDAAAGAGANWAFVFAPHGNATATAEQPTVHRNHQDQCWGLSQHWWVRWY